MRTLVEEQIGPFKDRLEVYRNQGWVVTTLEEAMVTEDPKIIKDRFEEFERDVKSLDVLKEALMDLDAMGFEDDVRAVDANLKDVTKIVEIEDDILKLQLKIERRKKAERRREEEERRERSSFIKKMDEWREQGFNTSRLEKVLDTDLGAIEIVFKAFERDVNEINKLKGMLENLMGKGFDEELEALNSRIMDPDLVFESEEDLLRIKLRIERREKNKAVRQEAEKGMRERFQDTLEGWKSTGLKVGDFEEVMGKDIDTIAEAFERAKKDIGRLKVLREELEDLDTSGHEEEVAYIETMLKDLSKVRDAEDGILDLQLKIERRKKEERRKRESEDRTREELKEKIVTWRAEGFVTDYLYSMLNGDLGVLRTSVEDFEAAARKLREIEEELDTMDTVGYDGDVESIKSKCRDVRLTDEVENDVLNLLVRSRRERQEKLRTDQITETLSRWKSEGFVVEEVEDLVGKADLKTLEREFVTHKIGIHTLRELGKDLDSLESDGFEEDVSRIREMMRNIDHIPTVEDMIFDIQRRIEESLEQARTLKMKESKEKHQYVEKLSEWVSEGFREGIIERLEQVISRDQDMDSVRSAFKTFESEVARVKELREVLATLDAKGFEAEVADLKNRLTNIDEVSSVEADMMALINKIERRHEEEEKMRIEDTQKRMEFTKQLEQWAEEGFHVERLRQSVEEDDLVNLRRNFVIFRIRIQKMRELARQLEALADPVFKEDRDRILPLLKDINNLEQAEKEMDELRQKVERAREEDGKRTDFENKMRDWEAQGFNVDRLERALAKDDMDFISKEFLVFKIRMQKLEELREELTVLILSAKNFVPEVEGIRTLLKDVDSISEIRENISTLKATIEEKREEIKRKEEDERRLREELETKLTKWATQGINVEELERGLDGPLDVVQASFDEYERGIARISRLREELAGLDTMGYEGEVALISNKLSDIRAAVEAEEELELLKEKIRRGSMAGQQVQVEEERVRKELEDKVSVWREQGYDVSTLVELLDKDLEELRKAFVVFRIRAERLKELEEDLKGMNKRGFEDRVENILKDIKKVDRLGAVTSAIAELQAAIKEKRYEERRKREEERKERETFATKMVQWISEGYNVAPLEGVINKDMELIKERFADFEVRVGRLKELEPELEDLEMSGHAREAKELRTMMMDVERINHIIERINEIRGDRAIGPFVEEEQGGEETESEPEPKVRTEEDAGSGSILDNIRERIGALKFEAEDPQKEEAPPPEEGKVKKKIKKKKVKGEKKKRKKKVRKV